MKSLFLLVLLIDASVAARAVELTTVRSDLAQPLFVPQAGDGSIRMFFV